MTPINKNFTLSFTGNSSIPTYQFKSGEVLSRKLSISLIQNEVAFDLTGLTAKIYILKPDNTKIFDNCVIEDAEKGLISYVLTTQCTTSIGTSKAEIVIYGTNNEKIISQTFQFAIIEAIEDDDAIESTNEFTALTVALDDAATFKTEMENAHYDNVTNTDYDSISLRMDAQSASLADKANKSDLATANANITTNANNITTLTTTVQQIDSGMGETYTSLSALQTTYPTGNNKRHVVIGSNGVQEVDTLTVTGVPTASGNISITLNGVATNVAVTVGTAEVASLSVTAACTTNGNATVTLNGVATTVALTTSMNTATLVATAIRGATFTGWTIGGTGTTVTFTSNTVGVQTDAIYSAGSTGATGTMTTTTQGVAADTTTTVATKIRGTSFSGWTTGGTGTTVTFTKSTVGTNTPISFNAGTTGVTATTVVTTAGVSISTSDWYWWNGTTWVDGGVYQSMGIAKSSISPDLVNFLKMEMANVYNSSENENGALNVTTGQDTVNSGFLRTGYIPINNGGSGDGCTVIVNDYTASSSGIYFFIYAEKGVVGYRVTDYTTISTNCYSFKVSGNYKYFRTVAYSATNGSYVDNLQVLANSYPNALTLNNYNIDNRYIHTEDLDIRVGTKNVYDNISISGGLLTNGTDASTNGYARTNYLSLNNENDAVNIPVSIYGLPSGCNTSYMFLYTTTGTIGFSLGGLVTYNSQTGSYDFTVPSGGYKYLRFNCASPSWTLTGELKVLVGKDEVEINGTELGNFYFTRNGDTTNPITESTASAIISEEVSKQLVTQSNQKMARPSNGVVNFSTNINVNFADVTSDTLSIQDGDTELIDDALLLLPTNYSQTGTPIRLVISCHGAGTTITSSSTALGNPVPNLLRLGYAVLDCNGIPKSLSIGNTGLHFGSPITLQCYLKAYEYAITNYNLKTDVFVIGTSMGGLSSNMLVQSGSIPIIAQGSFCGVTDHFKQAYCNPWSSGQRQSIATLFGFTGTPPTFTASGYPTQDEINYYIANIDKVIGYNPMIKNTINWSNSYLNDYNNDTEQTEYNGLIKYHPVPLKVWHNDDDPAVAPRYSEYYVNSIKRMGGLAFLRKFPSGGHNAWDNGNTTILTDINGNSFSVTASTYELYKWFKRFEN